ncbi:MAG: TRAP transporter large permease [Casimicrobiaceae bacterium]
MTLLLLFGALIVLIVLGFPVLLAIGITALGGIIFSGDLTPALFPQKMFAMLDSFSLLALPYFILAGELMARGGLSKKLVEFAETVVGHLRGGLGHASVVSSMIFAGVSGSSTADTSAIGSILIPSMKGRGYKAGFAAALVACAGTIGAIIPPSMTMIVYGSMTGVSIGGLFLGGILPGVLIAIGLMLVIYLYSLAKNFPELRETSGRFRAGVAIRALGKVWLALMAPVIIIGGILSGVFTATEAGVVACAYSFIVAFLVYRIISWRDLPKILVDTAVTSAMVIGIIGVAGALGWLLSYLDFNDAVMKVVGGVSGNGTIVMITLLGLMLVLGMLLESLAVMIILVPVISTIALKFGFDPIHVGILITMVTQIGATTPPVAVLLFVATSIAGTTYDQTVKYCWAFIIAEVAVLALVFFVPAIATWIPRTFMS